MFLASYGTTVDFEGLAENRIGEFYDGVEDFSAPQGVVLATEDSLLDYRSYVYAEVKSFYQEMEMPLAECRWHFTGWVDALPGATFKRRGSYELIPTQDLYQKTFEVPTPIAVIVVQEIEFWTKP
jgi:hypothetical protein